MTASLPLPGSKARIGSAMICGCPHARIEAGVGVLEDHGDAFAHALQGGGARRQADVLAIEQDAPRRRRNEADDHLGDRRLAGAGFADQRERLAAPDAQGDAVDGLQVLLHVALDDAIEPGLRDVERAREIGDLDRARSNPPARLWRVIFACVGFWGARLCAVGTTRAVGLVPS